MRGQYKATIHCWGTGLRRAQGKDTKGCERSEGEIAAIQYHRCYLCHFYTVGALTIDQYAKIVALLPPAPSGKHCSTRSPNLNRQAHLALEH